MRGAPQADEAQAIDALAGATRAGATRAGATRADGRRADEARADEAEADRHPLLVAGLTAGVATVGATIFAISPLLPDIAARFGIGAAQAGRLVAVFGLAMAIVAPLVGLFARRLPRASIIVSGLLLFAIAWLAAGYSERFETLLAFTLLAGAATGAVIPATYAYAGDLSPYEHRSRVMGRIVSGWPIAILLVVPSMSLAAQHIGWQLAFAALAVAALASAATIAFAPRPAPPLPAPLRDAQHEPISEAPSVLASLRRVFAHRGTRIVLLVDCIDMGAFYCVYAFLGSEMRRVNEWGAAAAGLAIAAYGLGLLVVTLNGRFVDRAGKGRSAVLSLYALGAILVVLPWSVALPPLLVAAVVAWGCVQGVFFTAITSLATEQIPALRGVVTAMLSGATYLGVTLFTPLGVQLYERAGFAAVGLFAAASCVIAGLLLRASPAVHSR